MTQLYQFGVLCAAVCDVAPLMVMFLLGSRLTIILAIKMHIFGLSLVLFTVFLL